MRGFIRQVYQRVGRGRFTVRQTSGRNGSNDSEAFVVFHLNLNVLKDLIIQSVAAVELTYHIHTKG